MKINFQVDIFEYVNLPFLMNGTKNRRYGLDQRHLLCEGLRWESHVLKKFCPMSLKVRNNFVWSFAFMTKHNVI